VGGLFARAKKFAASPEAKKYMRQASDYAKSPKGKRQIADLRTRLTASRKKQP
jgi:hypothetical protein